MVRTFDEVVAEHQSDSDLGDFRLETRQYWVVKCKVCNHQVSGPWPQTEKAKQAAVTNIRGKTCKNCEHEAGKLRS